MVVKDYQGKLLNGPNDVWIRPGGGLYFTDPYYKRPYWKRGPKEMDECVYYLAPDYKTLTRVIDDMKQPNGIIGTPDGKLLYVADIGAGKTYRYRIQPDGSLKEKKLFCELGSDGMTIDSEGNIYLTGKGVSVFDPAGKKIEHIEVPETWTANVCFGGKDRQTLFITASKELLRAAHGGPRRGQPVGNGEPLHLLRFLVNDHFARAAQIGGMVARNGHLQLLELDRRGLLVHQPDRDRHAVDDGLGPRGAAGNVEVHRDDLLHRPDDGVGIEPDAAAAGAGADGKDELGGGHGFVSAPEGLGRGAHRRALAEHHIGVARRADQLDAEALDVVVGREDVEHFDVAAVAAAAVGVIDPQRPAEHLLAEIL